MIRIQRVIPIVWLILSCALASAAPVSFEVDEQGRLARFRAGEHPNLLLRPVSVRLVDSLTKESALLSGTAKSTRDGSGGYSEGSGGNVVI